MGSSKNLYQYLSALRCDLSSSFYIFLLRSIKSPFTRSKRHTTTTPKCLFFFPPIYNNALRPLSRHHLLSSPRHLPPPSPSSELAGDASDWSLPASPPFKAPSRTVPLPLLLSWSVNRFVLVFLVKDAWPPMRSIFSRFEINDD